MCVIAFTVNMIIDFSQLCAVNVRVNLTIVFFALTTNSCIVAFLSLPMTPAKADVGMGQLNDDIDIISILKKGYLPRFTF